MKNLESMALRWTEQGLELLDQRLLPQREVWLGIQNTDDMISAIKALSVRGAPLIGVAAALALAKAARDGASVSSLREQSANLRAARPTAVNLMNAIDRMNPTLDAGVEKIMATAIDLFDEDVRLCNEIARHGRTVLQDGDRVLTHCNTGGLATAGVGTAFGILRRAHESGMKLHVFVDETRPLLQGGRLTAWECAQVGIPATLITDNMAAYEMSLGQVNKVIVGADRIAANGDFANKIGTYSLAVLCYYHRIPFYVAAPGTTVDPECASGPDIEIEQRHPDEVRGVAGAFGSVQWAAPNVAVDNPAFDVTPADLVSGWILDRGLLTAKDIKEGALRC